MYIKLEWTDEIGDIEEKEFWSWGDCFSFVFKMYDQKWKKIRKELKLK